MLKDKYIKILEQFEIHYRTYYVRAVDWWVSGRMAITVKLDNGEIIEYDGMDNTIRWIRTDEYLKNDEIRRKAFGHNVRKNIPFCGLSKTEIAEKLGITSAMLSRYIHGTSMPSADRAYQLAKILGCSTDELFDEHYME